MIDPLSVRLTRLLTAAAHADAVEVDGVTADAVQVAGCVSLDDVDALAARLGRSVHVGLSPLTGCIEYGLRLTRRGNGAYVMPLGSLELAQKWVSAGPPRGYDLVERVVYPWNPCTSTPKGPE